VECGRVAGDKGAGLDGMVGWGVADRLRWRLEEDRATRERSHHRPRVVAAGGEGRGTRDKEEEQRRGCEKEGRRRRKKERVGGGLAHHAMHI
jgi:hypothetical protein